MKNSNFWIARRNINLVRAVLNNQHATTDAHGSARRAFDVAHNRLLDRLREVGPIVVEDRLYEADGEDIILTSLVNLNLGVTPRECYAEARRRWQESREENQT